MKYRIIPVEVEAIQLTHNNLREVMDLIGREKHDVLHNDSQNQPMVMLNTSTGPQVAKIGDWITKTAEGAVSSHSDHYFRACYEPAYSITPRPQKVG